jgi:hypothetical protein
MHFCTAKVAIGGDTQNIRVRDPYDPVSWPELEVLRTLHGEEFVTDVEPFAVVKQPPKVERDRLALIYGEQVLAHIWGGQRPPHEMDSPDGAIKPGLQWFNPVTFELERVPEPAEPAFDPKARPEKPK